MNFPTTRRQGTKRMRRQKTGRRKVEGAIVQATTFECDRGGGTWGEPQGENPGAQPETTKTQRCYTNGDALSEDITTAYGLL